MADSILPSGQVPEKPSPFCQRHPGVQLPPSRIPYKIGCRVCKTEWRLARRQAVLASLQARPITLQEAIGTLERAVEYLCAEYVKPVRVTFGTNHRCEVWSWKWTDESTRQAVLILERKIRALELRQKNQLRRLSCE